MRLILKRKYFIFLFLFSLIGIVSCSSTGYVTKSNLVVPKTIKSPDNIPPAIVPYVPKFVDLLQEEGFSVGKTDDPRALNLVFEYNPNPFNLTVSVGLWRQGIPVLSASATNSGWGTVIAHGSAVNSLAESAAEEFEKKLKQFITHTKIVQNEHMSKTK